MLLFELTAIFWLVGLILSFLKKNALSRLSVCIGCITGVAGAIYCLPEGTGTLTLPLNLSDQPIVFSLDGAGLWLLGFGLFPALFACWVNGAVQKNESRRYWLAGVSCALLGALGVFGLQDAISFLIAWEMMSLGVALMLLGERRGTETGPSVYFMLALLEVGAIAIMVALLLLSGDGTHIDFASFAQNSRAFSPLKQLLIGVLLLGGFGAKLGLIPFYEWLPKAYSAGSGSSGAIASGVILNAAFYGLMRGIFVWLPNVTWGIELGAIVVLVAVVTAIWTVMHAFQQTDWRCLLSFSTAENAAIAVTTLGAGILFRQENLSNLAALAGAVALIHLAGHSLAKGAMFFVADGVYSARDSYTIAQSGLLKRMGWLFGVGALFAAMSLAAMPPQAGFVSEWYVFQTIFHGYTLQNLAGRMILIVAGAGMALTVAIALATFVKVFGVGLLGAKTKSEPHLVPFRIKVSIFILGLSVLALSVGMLVWINSLSVLLQAWFGFDSASSMHFGWLLVPLSDKFAFISPALLIIVTPLLALIPILLILLNLRYKIKRAPVWYGGLAQIPEEVATTALTFSNAMHFFYHFVYLLKNETKREYRVTPYFIKKVLFRQESTDVFTAYLFQPIVKFINYLAEKVRLFQSGNLNFYNSIIAILFILILLNTLF